MRLVSLRRQVVARGSGQMIGTAMTGAAVEMVVETVAEMATRGARERSLGCLGLGISLKAMLSRTVAKREVTTTMACLGVSLPTQMSSRTGRRRERARATASAATSVKGGQRTVARATSEGHPQGHGILAVQCPI